VNISDELRALQAEARAAIEGAGDPASLREVEVRYLGRKARLSEVFRDLRSLPDAERREVAQLANRIKQDLEQLSAGRRSELEGAQEERVLATDRIDLTLDGRRPRRGAPHPLVEVMRDLEDVFVGMGYEVAEGPEAETDWHNFQALNIPLDHPARSLMDTYYLTGPRGPESALLRTHTSPVQIRVMESRKPPIYVVCPGRVYRRDDFDATHSPMFNQIEGLAVDEGLTFAHLKGTLQAFAEGAFGGGTQVRLVPSYYQFTEPSVELQVTCPVCGGTGCSQCAAGWHGVGGAGMVDPNVFEFVGIDPERYTGFAFGMGLEKIPMTRYGIDDIRLFYEGDMRFLEQFRGRPVTR
jgi:phenylalanyl-tRNA synthetase alpha chain